MATSTVTFVRGGTTATINGPDAGWSIRLSPRTVGERSENNVKRNYQHTSTKKWTIRLMLSCITQSQRSALESFFNTVDGPRLEFTYTHTDGSAWNCRFAQPELRFSRSNENEFDVEIEMETYDQPNGTTSTSSTASPTTTTTTTTSTSTTTTTTSTTTTSTTSTSTTSTTTTTTTTTPAPCCGMYPWSPNSSTPTINVNAQVDIGTATGSGTLTPVSGGWRGTIYLTGCGDLTEIDLWIGADCSGGWYNIIVGNVDCSHASFPLVASSSSCNPLTFTMTDNTVGPCSCGTSITIVITE